MTIVKKMRKIHNKFWHPVTIKKIVDIIVAIPIIIMLYTLATICYLTEHAYNFCTGKGWTGMNLC